MDYWSFLGTVTTGGTVGGIIAALAIAFWKSYWTEKGKNLATMQDAEGITESVQKVKQQYAEALEKAKSEMVFQSVQRERAEQVAELLVEWLSHPEDRRRLNELTIKVTMWLPDKEAKELNDLLAWKNGVSTHKVISSIRRFIQGGNSDLGPTDITLFPMKPSETRSNHLQQRPITLGDYVGEMMADQEANDRRNA